MKGLLAFNSTMPEYGFLWPDEVGREVVDPLWNPTTNKNSHLTIKFLKNANGDWRLLHGDRWAVVSVPDGEAIEIGDGLYKAPRCVLEHVTDNPRTLRQYFSEEINSFCSSAAYHWGLRVGDKGTVVDRVTDPMDAFLWAKNIGNYSYMKKRITDSLAAYLWCVYFGDDPEVAVNITDDYYKYIYSIYQNWQDFYKKKPKKSNSKELIPHK